MKPVKYSLPMLLAISMFCSVVAAQESATASSSTTVPRLVNFSGKATDAQGKTISGIAGATFAIYKDQYEGSPLWLETQNVQADSKGNYTVQLGAASSSGLPLDLFITGEARWLGVRINGGEEQQRVLLLSVPYALKAADAETIGGLPPSAFLLAAPSNSPANASAAGSVTSSTNPSPLTLGGSGTLDFVPLWTPNGSTLGNSVMFQSGSGSTAKIGVNTTKPTSTLDVHGAGTVRGNLSLPATGTATATGGKNSQPTTLTASVFNSSTSAAVPQNFRWQAEPVGNDTGTASGSLNLLYGAGTNPINETGLHIASNGQITFASGQTFPGTGSVTSVGLSAPASDFLVTGSPVTTQGTLGLNWNVAPTSSSTGNAIVKRDVNGNFWANYIGASFIDAASTLGGSPVVSGLDNNATGNGNGGVYGYSYGKIGVLGGCSGSQGCSGVYGDAPSLNGGFGFGVQGTSTLGPGIAGFNNSIGSLAGSLLGTVPIGVIGDSNGYGVVATSDLSNALVAETGSSTTSDTVVINNLGGGFPLYAAGTGGSMYLDGAGNLHVSGQIFGSVKNFEIDHPLDPANKYLVHASVESSEMKNIYDGIAVLDADGSVTVELPDWFEAVNADFRYQLTAMGAPGPNLHIAQEIANNRFAIAGGQPGTKVCWQVTGVRHDAYAKAHPLQVSVEKSPGERGFYIHPDLYGALPAKGLAAAHRTQVMQHAKQTQAQASATKR